MVKQLPQARVWIKRFGLEPHPEGGYYRQTYVSDDTIPMGCINRFGGSRPCSTGIYYMLVGEDKSHLHRIKSDEMWHFYSGTDLVIHVFGDDGGYSRHQLGPQVGAFQFVVPQSSWFGAEVADCSGYALVGCTVSPGFSFQDFELADREMLLARYPDQHSIILRMT